MQAAGLKFDQGDPSLTLTKVESATLRFAKLYVVAGAIWPPVEANTLQASRLASEGYDPLQRYPLELSTAESSLASDNGTILGAVHEFYVLMPEDLRVQTLPSSFFKKVSLVTAVYVTLLIVVRFLKMLPTIDRPCKILSEVMQQNSSED